MYQRIGMDHPELIFNKNAHGRYLIEMIAGGALIVDVRSPAEYQSGHIANAINISIEDILTQTAYLKQFNKPVITVCKDGYRSCQVIKILKKEGIEAFNGGPWEVLAAYLADEK